MPFAAWMSDVMFVICKCSLKRIAHRPVPPNACLYWSLWNWLLWSLWGKFLIRLSDLYSSWNKHKSGENCLSCCMSGGSEDGSPVMLCWYIWRELVVGVGGLRRDCSLLGGWTGIVYIHECGGLFIRCFKILVFDTGFAGFVLVLWWVAFASPSVASLFRRVLILQVACS